MRRTGGRIADFDWPSDGGRGRVLVQGGRADVFEKYLGAIAHLHGRGWSVTSFDWRGQGGSGRLGRDAAVGHAESFATHIGDLAAFWAGWAGRDERQVLLAHSMGGHFALRAAVEGRIRPDAMVLSAPMVRVRSPIGQRLGGWLARAMAWARRRARGVGRGTRAGRAGGAARRCTVARGPEQDERWWEADEGLRLGPPSWGWVAEAFRSGAALEADPRLTTMAVPTLFLIPDHDQLVVPAAAHRVAARLPGAEVVAFGPEAGHEVLREGPAVRARPSRPSTTS
jgi:lysophospholipase